MTYYEMLGVSSNDSLDVIKREYRTRVKKYHPDLQQSEEWKVRATEYLQSLNEAYDTLSDPYKKAEYDLTLKQSYTDWANESYTQTSDAYEPAYEYGGASGGQENYSNNPVSPLRSFLGSFLGKILIFVLIFGVGNGILYIAQGFGHADEKAQMKEIKTYLDSETPNLENMAIQLNSLSSDINKLDSQMNIWYDSDVDQYNANVDRFNTILTQYNSMYDSYESKLNAYNAKVDEYNALAEKVGTEWYIIPVPVKSKI